MFINIFYHARHEDRNFRQASFHDGSRESQEQIWGIISGPNGINSKLSPYVSDNEKDVVTVA